MITEKGMFMTERTTLRLGVLVLFIGLMASTIGASPNIFVSDPSLYLELGQASAFNLNTRTDAELTKAVLPLRIRTTNPSWETEQVLNMTIVIDYNADSLQLFTALVDAATWTESNFAYYDSASVGRVTLAFRGGAVPLTSTFTHFADVVFIPRCRPEGSTVSVPFHLDYRTWIVNRSTGDSHVPTAEHCTAGTVTIPDYTATFSITSPTYSGSRVHSVPVAVMASVNNRFWGFHNWIRYNPTKLQIDSVVVRGVWSTWGIDLTQANMIGVEPYRISGANPEMMNDTMYVIWLSPTCSTAVNDTAILSPVAGTLIYYPYPCHDLEIGPVLTAGTVSIRDSAELRACLPSGSAEVSRSSSATVQYNVQLRNSFVTGSEVEGAGGVTMCVRSGTAALDGPTIESLVSGLSWDGAASLTTEEFAIFQNHPGEIAVSPGTTWVDQVAIHFSWNPANYSPVNWNQQYIKPWFPTSYDGYTTRAPFDGCNNLVAQANPSELKYGSFRDSVKVLMAQVGTNSVSGSPCVWQTVRIRGNFNIDSLRVVMQVPSNANCIETSVLLAGISLTSLGSGQYRLAGNVSINAGTNYTDIAKFRLEPKNCTSGIQYQNLSLTKVRDSIYSNTNPLTLEFSTPLDAGVASVSYRCIQVPCSGIFSDPRDSYGHDVDDGLPSDFSLGQNYPNPFNPTTTISLTLPIPTDWRVTIINVAGQVVKEFHGNSGPGVVTIDWDASDYASGVYMYRLEAGSFSQTKKMILIR